MHAIAAATAAPPPEISRNTHGTKTPSPRGGKDEKNRSPAINFSHRSGGEIKMPAAFNAALKMTPPKQQQQPPPLDVTDLVVQDNGTPTSASGEGENRRHRTHATQSPALDVIRVYDDVDNDNDDKSTNDDDDDDDETQNHSENEMIPQSPTPMPRETGNAGNHETNRNIVKEQLRSKDSAAFLRSSIDLSTSDSGLDGVRDSLRDRYGFRKESNFITSQQYDDWWKDYKPYILRRKRKWEKLMRESGLETVGPDGGSSPPVRFPPVSHKLKRYVRKGIPAEWRGAAWFWYARGPELLKKHPGLYDKLWQEAISKRTVDNDMIERDLHRTFPDNIYFRKQNQNNMGGDTSKKLENPGEETALIKALRRVLLALAIYVPSIGYCQSLNFLAGILLLFMEEERAFWTLYILTDRYLPGMHAVNLEGANIDQGVLMLCVKEALPNVWTKISTGFNGEQQDDNYEIVTKLPPITLCTASWFMSGYIGCLPIETALRVWDSLFLEDSKVFFRVALTIFKLSAPQLSHVKDPTEVFQLVQNMPKHYIDANHLMYSCFRRRNGFGHLSQDQINERRRFVALSRKEYSEKGHVPASLDDSFDLNLLGFSGSGINVFDGSRLFRKSLGRQLRRILPPNPLSANSDISKGLHHLSSNNNNNNNAAAALLSAPGTTDDNEGNKAAQSQNRNGNDNDNTSSSSVGAFKRNSINIPSSS